jgi:predicted enzyme related to lactoylglutathione lyase
MKLLVNLLCQDIDRVCGFYAALLKLPELTASRSPIYRALDTGAAELGFNAPAARALLGLGDAAEGTNCFATFLVDEAEAVNAAAVQVPALGGHVVKPPYATYYGQWQVVLADPEGHVFRVSCLRLPASG